MKVISQFFNHFRFFKMTSFMICLISGQMNCIIDNPQKMAFMKEFSRILIISNFKMCLISPKRILFGKFEKSSEMARWRYWNDFSDFLKMNCVKIPIFFRKFLLKLLVSLKFKAKWWFRPFFNHCDGSSPLAFGLLIGWGEIGKVCNFLVRHHRWLKEAISHPSSRSKQLDITTTTI